MMGVAIGFLLLSIGLFAIVALLKGSNTGDSYDSGTNGSNASSEFDQTSQSLNQGLFLGAMLEDQNDHDPDRDWFRKGIENEFPSSNDHDHSSSWGDSGSDSGSSGGWDSSDSGSSDSGSDGW